LAVRVLAVRNAAYDHSGMRVFQRALIALAMTAVMPAAAVSAEASTGRELLQPPRNVIASPINDRFAVRALFYRPDISNQLRYDSSTGVIGTRIDVEEMLGHKATANQGTIDMMFRIGDRHRIHADFYQLRRTGDEVITGEIRFGDDVYVANDRLVSETELRKLGLAYTYSFFRRERLELGMGLALHLLQLDGRTAVPARFVDERLDTAGPFAALVGQGSWRITRRFSVNVSGQYFDLSPDDVRGAFRGFHGDLQYRGWRNLSVGVGYTYSGYLVDSTDPEFSGFYRLEYKGPEAFLRVAF
jgi:hypothetical protein